jgi:hypothetical protein
MRGHQTKPRMQCGWGCGASLPFARCMPTSAIWPYWQAASGHGDHRAGELASQARTPAGARMLCIWGCSGQLTASRLYHLISNSLRHFQHRYLPLTGRDIEPWKRQQ